MENKLWSDIQSQGDNLVQVVRHLYTTERTRIEAAASFLRNDRPIVLIGVASAEYLCMPAEVYLAQCGRFVSVLCASDAYYSYLPALKNANVVINSRSGETAEIVKLGQALVENNIPFVAVTNEPESSLARLATHIVWANTRKDELVSINVVTGMMTTTLVLAAAVTGEMDQLKPAFETLAGAMYGIVERAEQEAQAIVQLMLGVRPIYLLYRGHSKGAAYCGRLVLEEVSRMPSIAMEAAEFRQGPNEVIDERFGAVIFVSDGKQGALNKSLAGDILRLGGRVMVVGNTNGDIPDGAEHNLLAFPINSVPDFLRPVLEVVPVQMLAYQLASAQGYEPGEVRYISKIILSEEGIPNQR
jgi:glutamine---fructose-6-phosphate transaminase (isomerizing)